MNKEVLRQLVDIKDGRSREEVGAELETAHQEMLEGFRDLQRAVSGHELPFSSTFAKICVSRVGGKRVEARVYGYPAHDPAATEPTAANLATRYPHQASRFTVYYGRTYGQPGYDAYEHFGAANQESLVAVASGQAGWEQTSLFQQMVIEGATTLAMLRQVAMDESLNPDIAPRVRDYYTALEGSAEPRELDVV